MGFRSSSNKVVYVAYSQIFHNFNTKLQFIEELSAGGFLSTQPKSESGPTTIEVAPITTYM